VTIPTFSPPVPVDGGLPSNGTDPVPDHTKSNDTRPLPPPVTPSAKKGEKDKGNPIRNLGTNMPSKRARQLTDEDRQAIIEYYSYIGMSLMLFKPELGETIGKRADKCADAWMELAKKNDSVRRALLAMMEGSAWSAVIAAHLPILLAAIPDRAVANNPLLGMARNLGVSMDDEDAESEPTNEPPGIFG